MRILVVEDNSVSRELAMHMLKQLGHEVATVGNGRAAVDLQTTQPFDLIVMDVWMPEMDGLEACRKIRELEVPNGRRTPIIALTAHAIRGDRAACIAAGMDEYLTKPIRRQTLLEAIQRVTAAEPRPVVNPAGSSAPAVPIAENSLLGPWVGADADVLYKLGPVMIESTKTSVSDMYRALETREWITLEREAHSLKGSLGIFHAAPVVDTVRRIEECARRHEQGNSEVLMQRLQSELELVHREVEVRCAGPAPSVTGA